MVYSQQISDKLKMLTDAIDVHPGSARVEIVGYRDEAQALNPGAYVLEFSDTRGSLYDILKIVTQLKAGALIDGVVPDLEAMFYQTMPDKPFQIGNNVRVQINAAGKCQLEFTPAQSEEKTLAGLDAAFESTSSALRFKNEQTAAWQVKVRAAAELDHTAKPVFGVKEDVRVVSEYITSRTEASLPGSNPQVEYKNYGDGAAVFNVKVSHTPGESLTSLNDLMDKFGRVFVGSSTVGSLVGGRSKHDSEFEFTVIGNPARLIGDIKKNDPNNLPKSAITIG